MIVYAKSESSAEPLDALVVMAHPDDAEITMGGTIALMTDRGRRVGIVDLTRGELGSRGTPDERLEESRAAAEVLGVPLRVNLELADGFFEPTVEARLALVDVIRRWQPPLVFTHHAADPHPDHVNAWELTRAAAHNAGLRSITTGHPAFRPSYVFSAVVPHRAEPSFLVDVSTHWETKLRAIRCHRSQVEPAQPGEFQTYLSRPDFFDTLAAHARSYGSLVGAERAEAFHSTSRLLLGDPVETFSLKRGRLL